MLENDLMFSACQQLDGNRTFFGEEHVGRDGRRAEAGHRRRLIARIPGSGFLPLPPFGSPVLEPDLKKKATLLATKNPKHEGLHSTEVAYLLLIQLPWVRFLALLRFFSLDVPEIY